MTSDVDAIVHSESVADEYAKYHSERYAYLMQLSKRLAPDTSTVLDIGRSPFAAMLLSHYPNLHTLGFPLTASDRSSVPSSVPHITYDLNRAQNVSDWITLPEFDLIIFAEVIEHLHTAPELVLRFLASGLKRGGHLIVQTPNAVSLQKRILPILGRNPYERIRVDTSNPGHFREYTKRELVEIGNDAGLQTVYHAFRNYFGVYGGSLRKSLVHVFHAATLPFPPLRRGQTIVYRKP